MFGEERCFREVSFEDIVGCQVTAIEGEEEVAEPDVLCLDEGVEDGME